MQWRLKELIAKYEVNNPGQTLTYRRMQDDTGISTTAIHRIAVNKAERADLGTMNTLLNYFSELLDQELTVPDLLRYERDRK